jgi:hypothetical protein
VRATYLNGYPQALRRFNSIPMVLEVQLDEIKLKKDNSGHPTCVDSSSSKIAAQRESSLIK